MNNSLGRNLPNHKWSNWLLSLLSISVFIGYLLPQWLALFQSTAYAYVNAWDEETYLSWQGVLGGFNQPGYFVLGLNWVLHKMHISGAMQNLFFDSTLPPLTVYLSCRSFELCGVRRSLAFPYAVVICFSSTIFNYADPLIVRMLGNYNVTALFMAGHELYPSILRTPNPQISYALIATAVYFFLRFRKNWILLVPIPVLYYFVAVPYVFLLLCAFFRHFLGTWVKRTDFRVLLSASAAFFCITVVLVFLFRLGGLYEATHPFRLNSFIFVETSNIQIPLVLLLAAGGTLSIFYWECRGGGSPSPKVELGAWLCFAIFATSNIQLVTGFMLSQKNYYDYGISILAGLMLALMVESVTNDKLKRALLVGLLLIISAQTASTQMPWYREAVRVGRGLDQISEDVKNDPLHAIIPDLGISSKLAYSSAQMLSPPFSYQYYFSFIERQCSFNEQLLARALLYAVESRSLPLIAVDQLKGTAGEIKKGRYLSGSMPYKNKEYCQYGLYSNSQFYTVPYVTKH